MIDLKTLSISFVLLFITLFSSGNEHPQILQQNFLAHNSQATTYLSHEMACNHGQCYATAKSTGKRCKHCVSNSRDLYCWQHD